MAALVRQRAACARVWVIGHRCVLFIMGLRESFMPMANIAAQWFGHAQHLQWTRHIVFTSSGRSMLQSTISLCVLYRM